MVTCPGVQLSGGSLVRGCITVTVRLLGLNPTHPTDPTNPTDPNPNPNPIEKKLPDKWTPGQMRGYLQRYCDNDSSYSYKFSRNKLILVVVLIWFINALRPITSHFSVT